MMARVRHSPDSVVMVRCSLRHCAAFRPVPVKRVPPWQFVVDLLDDVTACRGHLVPPADVARLLRLHRAAVRSGSAAARPVKVLELQLAEADLDARSHQSVAARNGWSARWVPQRKRAGQVRTRSTAMV
ncbi:hypothetical protein ACU686_12360 [Yinghuangia aomiensis]